MTDLREAVVAAVQSAVENMPYANGLQEWDNEAEEVRVATLREFLDGTSHWVHADTLFAETAKVAADAALAIARPIIEREMVERCAKVAEEQFADTRWDTGYGAASNVIARKLRALTEEPR